MRRRLARFRAVPTGVARAGRGAGVGPAGAGAARTGRWARVDRPRSPAEPRGHDGASRAAVRRARLDARAVADPRRRPGRGARRGSRPDAARRPLPGARGHHRLVRRRLRRPRWHRHHRLGTPRRGAADRRDQPARRVEIPARRASRRAPAGGPRARALVRRREGDRRSGVGAAVHARPLRRARRGQLALQPPRRRRTLHAVAGLSACGAVHPPRAGAVTGDVARRRPPERHHRPGGLGARRLQRVSGVRPHLGRADRPAPRHAARLHSAGHRLRDLPALHDDRRRRGDGARRLGDSRRDGGHDRRHRRHRHVAARRSRDTACAPASAPIARPAPFASTAPSSSSAVSRTRNRGSGIAGGADTNVSLVVGGDRGFARDTRTVRVFGAWNVADSSGFARTIGTWSLRDNLSLGRLGRLVLRRRATTPSPASPSAISSRCR